MDAQRPANADESRRAAERDGRKANEFRTLWDLHYPRIRTYAARRVGRDDADDVAVAVFETAWRRWNSLPAADETLWWLLACARRLCANHRRSLTRRTSLTERLRGSVTGGGTASAAGDFVEQLVLDAAVRTALAELSPDDREALLLSVWDDLDTAGVAAVLGVSRSAAQKRVVRAREKFEKKYVEVSAGSGDRTLTGEETP